MIKYTAEQVRDIHWNMAKDYKKIPALAEHHKAMGDSIDALLRERESAKAAVTDEMIERAARAMCRKFDPPSSLDEMATCDKWRRFADEARCCLEAVVPMLASAGVPDGWQLVPIDATSMMQSAGGHANSEWLNNNAPIGENRYGGPVMRSVWQAMLAAAPKPETEE